MIGADLGVLRRGLREVSDCNNKTAEISGLFAIFAGHPTSDPHQQTDA
jgi:hypothetical protein